MSEKTLFFTLGMFIIDEIHHANPSIPSKYNIIGGGGTFGGLGSRIVSPSSEWKRIRLIVDKGSDFPNEIMEYLNSWEIDITWREDKTRLTTRGWNYYHDDGPKDKNKVETRDFEYLAPKKRIKVQELENFETETLHMICSIDRAQEAVQILKDKDTITIFEPVPYECVPEQKNLLLSVIPDIDILSPNAKEAADIFGIKEPTDKKELELLASRFILYLNKKNRFGTGYGALILRCGAIGSYTLAKLSREGKVEGKWYPPYHTNPNKVIDPTGCGNTFVGSFVTAFVLSQGSYDIASVCGSIGSGVCIETLGMPDLKDDCWNGLSLKERIDIYLEKNDLDVDRSIYSILNLE